MTGDWTAGYVSDIGYTYGYYQDLNPARVKLALLNKGFQPPTIKTACELGFGQGVSIAMHAAASQVDWFGTDFNPSQAAFAQELNARSGACAMISDEAFEEFCSRPDLPGFDFIGLHGIWSWISDENRAHITDFIRRKLNVGGVVYVSYNTLPGWASFAPVRHLMTEHASILGADGQGLVSRIDDAIGFAHELLDVEPLFAQALPNIKARLEQVKSHDRHYLAHEYFNRDWCPMYFADVAERLTTAKLQFAASAQYTDHISTININDAQQEFVSRIPDPMLKEAVLDFVTNKQFRKDYWVKGLRRLSPAEQMDQLREVAIVLTANRADVSLTVDGTLGEANLTSTIYGPILDKLANHEIYTLGELETALQPDGITLQHLIEAAMILNHKGVVGIVADTEISNTEQTAAALNQWIRKKAKSSGDIPYQCSPILGGGVPLSRFHQLYALSLSEGKETPDEWAQDVQTLLLSLQQRIMKDGEPLSSDEEQLRFLLDDAKTFEEKVLPGLKALKVVT